MTKKRTKKIGILGYGEVGKAIAKFYKRPLIKDLTRDDFKDKQLDVLNVCLPYNQNFNKIILEVAKINIPKLIIIHSTVPVGTTMILNSRLNNVVHSPIRGVHPHLYKGIRIFTKYVGADNMAIGYEVAKHLRKIGIRKVKVLGDSETTELGKLLSTTYYGLCIAYHSYAKKLCDYYNLNFENVMTEFNKSYNKGYSELGKKNVVRPVLFSPDDNIIGGHCIIPNAKILKMNSGLDPILKSILRHSKTN